MTEKKSNPWNERYAISDFYYGKEPNDFLKAHAARMTPGGRVLCLAEGEGRNAVYLAQLGYRVTAVDGSSVGLEKLKTLSKHANVTVETVCSDLADFEFAANSWDGIVSIWCHVPPALRKALHQSCVQALKSDGIFIFEAYHPRQLKFGTGGPKEPEWMSTVETLRQELVGLRFDIIREIDREVREGVGHNGMSAVAQALGIKE